MSQSTDQDLRKSRIFKSGLNVVIGSILFFVVLVGLYWLSSQAHRRVDLTSNHKYSLSASSKTLLNKLQDRVTVTVYATEKDTPPEWTQRRDELQELLSEYRNISNGKVQFTFNDVSPGSDSEKAAQEAGMQASLMQQSSASELKLNKGYFGLQAEYKGKNETIPYIAAGQSLEYQLTRVINKAAAINIPNVGLVVPGGNPLMGQASHFTLIKSELEEQGFKVTDLQPTKLGDLSKIKLLMLIDPQDLSPEALFQIDQYVMNGGKLFVAAPGVQLSSRMGQNSVLPKPPNINSILEYYGLRINSDLVEDWKGGREQTAITRSGTLVRYKDPLVFTTSDTSKDNAVTKNIPVMMFAYTSTVGPSDRGTSGTVKSLVTSSENSRLQKGPFTLEATELKPPTQEEKTTPKDLVMMVSGSLTSRYSQEKPPVLTNDDGTTHTPADSEILKKSKGDPKVVVLGSSLLLVDQALQGVPANVLLPLNVAESFTRGGDILALRARDLAMPRLREVSPAEARWTQVLIIGGIPLLLIIFGFLNMILRRRRRARYGRIYGNSVD